jgi:hypothetical protein
MNFPKTLLWCCCNNNNEPVIPGEAIEVPSKDARCVFDPEIGDNTDTPFATISGFILPSSEGPQLLKSDITTLFAFV